MANYVLEILGGDRAGEVLPVGDATIRIGRKAGNDIVIADEKTSGVHCEISPEGDRLVLKDLGSTNGTFLDGKRVTELVLTPGDVVTVGRTKVKFRAEGADATEADAGEFAMRKLDAGRLQKRGGSIGLLAVLLLVAGAGGGWFWWQSEQQSGGSEVGPSRAKDALAVAGNKLQGALASCETDDGWALRVAGTGFRAGSRANTGRGSFSALRGNDEVGELPAGAKGDDFAVMQLAEPVEVFAGRTMTVAAYLRTSAGGKMAIRARVFAGNEAAPFRFCNGSPMAAYEDGWQRIETVVTVPSGCDRMLVEVVAVLPTTDSEAMVDDIAVVEGGADNGIQNELRECGQSAVGFGSSLAVRSIDVNNPATVLTVVPDAVPAEFTQLHEAGYCVLSDLGASLSCVAEEKGLGLTAKGIESLQFVMPVEAAGGLMSSVDGSTYAPVAAQSEFAALGVLFGSYATRAVLRFESETAVQGTSGAGLYRLGVGAAKATLVLGFRAERIVAGNFMRSAKAALSEGEPGQALDDLTTLMTTVPMDSEELAASQKLRGEILMEQSIRFRQLDKDLEEAGFFDTRGGFERVVVGVEELILAYGEHNLADLKAAQALRAKAQEQLVALDRSTYKAQRARLTALADAFGSAQQLALQKIVQDYVTAHLPVVAEEPGGKD